MPVPKHRTTQSQRTPRRSKSFLPAGTGAASKGYRKQAKLLGLRAKKVAKAVGFSQEVRIGSQEACRRQRRVAAASLRLLSDGMPSIELYRAWARGMRVNPGQMAALAAMGKVMALGIPGVAASERRPLLAEGYRDLRSPL